MRKQHLTLFGQRRCLHAPSEDTSSDRHGFFFLAKRPNSNVPVPEGKFIEVQISAEPGSAYGIQLIAGPPWFPCWSGRPGQSFGPNGSTGETNGQPTPTPGCTQRPTTTNDCVHSYSSPSLYWTRSHNKNDTDSAQRQGFSSSMRYRVFTGYNAGSRPPRQTCRRHHCGSHALPRSTTHLTQHGAGTNRFIAKAHTEQRTRPASDRHRYMVSSTASQRHGGSALVYVNDPPSHNDHGTLAQEAQDPQHAT